MSTDYYQSKDSVKEYIQLAKDVSGAELIEKLKQFLPANSSLLELGSGPGTDWNILQKDYQVQGSDYSEEFITHLQTTYPDGTFLELDAISLESDQLFDGLYSNKVLHHLSDEELASSINKQAEILNSQGIICHSFWKGEGSEVFKGMFVNYHDEVALKEIFGKSFEILLLEPYAEFEKEDSLLLIAKKKGSL